MTFSNPIDDISKPPIGQAIFTRPVFEFNPTEPAGGILLQENGRPLLQENGRFLALEPLVP